MVKTLQFPLLVLLLTLSGYNIKAQSITFSQESYSCGSYNTTSNTYSYDANITASNSSASAITITASDFTFSNGTVQLEIAANTSVQFSGTASTPSFTISENSHNTVFETTCNYFTNTLSDNDWSESGNWSKGNVPSTTDHAIIAYETNAPNGTEVSDLTLQSGVTFNMWSFASVTVTNALIVEDSTEFLIKGLLDVKTVVNNGKIRTLCATTKPYYVGKIFVNEDLTNTNNINLQAGSLISISGILDNTSGTIIMTATDKKAAKLQVQTVSNQGAILYDLYAPTSIRTTNYNASDPNENLTLNFGLISPPLSGMTLSTFTSAKGTDDKKKNTDLFSADKYNGGDSNIKLFGPYINESYVNYSLTNDANTSLTPGLGYRISTFSGLVLNDDLSSDESVLFKGNILTGTQNVNFTSNSDGWNLIGNPYTTSLSLNTFVQENNNNLHANATGITYWDNTNGANGQFISKTASELAASDITIAPGQAFFIAPDTNISSVTFTTNQQSTDNGGTNFNRTSAALEGFDVVLSSNNISRSTRIYLDATTTNGIDKGYEAQAIGMALSGTSIYSMIADQSTITPFATQTIPDTALENTIIKLGFNAPTGNYTLSSNSINAPENVAVYLKDNHTSNTVLLNKNNYEFNLDEAAIDDANRFELYFENDALHINEDQFLNTQIHAIGKSVVIKNLPATTNTIRIADVQGRAIAYETIDQKQKEIKLSQVVNGVYIVSINNRLGNMSKKVILKN